jgi:steroid 5-alpha reductase family enzyme
MAPIELFGLTAAAVAAGMVLLWLLSVALEDVSIADIYWGPGFALISWIAAVAARNWTPRTFLLLALVSVWALRLALHLLLRRRRVGVEDRRYAAMRRKAGRRFVLRSLVSVFALQGAIMWVVSLPLQMAMMGSVAPLRWFGGGGVVLFAVGWICESVADGQLTAFRRDPRNAGRVLDTGLWAWSRHPNYFGEVVLWWGLFVVSVGGSGAWWTIVSPMIVTVLLLRVSGIPLLERGMDKRRPGYADYVDRTSAFMPSPPRRRRT